MSQSLYAAYDAMHHAVAVLDAAGRVRHVNAAFRTAFALDDAQATAGANLSFALDLRPLQAEDRVLVRDQALRIAPMPNGDWLLEATPQTTEDIARDVVFNAMELLEEGFALWDSDMRFVHCNAKYVEMILPYLDEPLPVGMTAQDAVIMGYRSGVIDLPAHVTEEAYIEECIDWAGSFGKAKEFIINRRVIIARSHPTELGGYLLTAVDVTNERNAEPKARDMLFDAFQALDEGLVLCDQNMRFVFGNAAWKRMMFEGGREHLIPAPGDSVVDSLIAFVDSGFYDIPEGMDRQAYIEWMMAGMAEHGKQVHFGSVDGRHFIGSSHLTAFGGALLFVRDVTKQHDSEKKRLAAVNEALDAIDDPLVLFTAEREFVLANEAWLSMVRGRADPVPGDTADTIFERLLNSGFYVIPDGMSAEDYLQLGLREMTNFTTDFPLTLNDGRAQLANARKTALGGFLLSYRDVTEQQAVEAELTQQRETAHQAEKLSALGELLAGVAHELNNPLSVVFGYSQMIQGKGVDAITSDRIDMICQSAERAAKIVRTFLAMARQRPMKTEACAIHDVVNTAIEVSGYTLKSNGTQLVTDFDQSAPHVMGDVDQLAQVFSNLLINAGHAVRDQGADGIITLRTRLAPDGTSVVVEVSDTGPGIPKDIQSRVFEPFFTTKDVGEGTGIGLAFSHRIVDSHAGQLRLASGPEGTTFFVHLPVTEASATPDAPTPVPLVARTSVLVIDDEVAVAQLICDMLEDEGFDVATCTDPRTALGLLEHRRFDAILSDFKMPDMNGETFYRALKAIAPDSAGRVGFITGDAMGAQVAEFWRSSARPYIEKPILKSELLALITTCQTRGAA